MSTETHYETLGVDPDASPTQIKRAYLSLMRTAHPDQGGSPDKAAAVTAAYDVLNDPSRRAEYDDQLRGHDANDDDDDDGSLGTDVPEDVEVVDDWGTEVPHPPPPPPPGFRPPPPPPPGFQPPPSYPGPTFRPGGPWPGTTRPRPKPRAWRRLWPAGHGVLTWVARILTMVVSLAVAFPIGAELVGVIVGATPITRLPTDLIAFAFMAVLLVGPGWRRSMGDRVRWEYGFFILTFVVGPVVALWVIYSDPTGEGDVAVYFLLGWGLLITLTAETRNYVLASGRATLFK